MVLSNYFAGELIAQCTYLLDGTDWQLKSKLLRVAETPSVKAAIAKAVQHATKCSAHSGEHIKLTDDVWYYAL
ncbi:MAG: hypothetical protein AAGG44_16135 [Planctomycetota bacterium]